MGYLIAAIIFGSIIYWSLKNGITPMPTSHKVKRELLALLPEVEGTGGTDTGSRRRTCSPLGDCRNKARSVRDLPRSTGSCTGRRIDVELFRVPVIVNLPFEVPSLVALRSGT